MPEELGAVTRLEITITHKFPEPLHVALDTPVTVSVTPAPNPATHATLTVVERTPPMPVQISVDSATASGVLTFQDDKGEATSAPEGATVAFSGDNDAVATVDGPSGKITPVLAGTFNLSATVTNADGTPTLEPDGVTPFSPPPVSIEVDPGAPVGDQLTVTP